MLAPKTPLPDTARDEYGRILARYHRQLRHRVVVIEDRGALAAIKRSVISFILKMAPEYQRAKIFGRGEDAGTWLAAALQLPKTDVVAVINAIGEKLESLATLS